MELRIDFYSKEEISIRLDFEAGPAFPQNETNEILVFTCYALRQFANFGNHPVGKVLGVLLTTFDRDTVIELARGAYYFPGKFQFGNLLDSAGVRINIDHDLLLREIMPGLPDLVDFRGQGEKAFVATIPPFLLHQKGFGILGLQVNYFSFQSTIALLRHLALRRLDDGDFLDHLSKVTQFCGQLHISRGAPMGDQLAMAKVILKELGIL